MNKRDYIWVALRIFGIYLLVQAVIAIPSLFSSSYMFYASWERCGLPSSTDSNIQMFDTIAKQARTAAGSLVLASLCQVILFSAAGYYLTRKGKWVFNMICPPEVESTKQADMPPQG